MAVEIGQLCVKLAGRDAGRECLIVKKLDNSFVLIDGNTRRRKCNIAHLELLSQKADIKENASHEEVAKALEKLGIKTIKRGAPREAKPKEQPKPKEEKKGLFGLGKPKEKKEEKPEKEKKLSPKKTTKKKTPKKKTQDKKQEKKEEKKE